MNIDVKKKREKRNTIIRWIIYYLIMIVEYILITTIQINIPLPLVLLATAISISVFEDPFDAALTGCVAGLFIDTAEGTLFGMNGIIIMWCCLMSSLLFYFVMRKHIINTLGVVAVATIVQTGFRYIFYYSIWGYDKDGIIYIKEFVPIIIVTIIFTFVIYPIIKLLYTKLGAIRDIYIDEKSDDIVRE